MKTKWRLKRISKEESKAYHWLISRGYKHENIEIHARSSPDFTCSDGKGFEVKKVTNNQIVFHKQQFLLLKQMKNVTILVYDQTEEENINPSHIVLMDNVENNLKIEGIKVYVSKGCYSVRFELESLKIIEVYRRSLPKIPTFSEAVNQLIKHYKKNYVKGKKYEGRR